MQIPVTLFFSSFLGICCWQTLSDRVPAWLAPCLTSGRYSAVQLSLRHNCRNNTRPTVPGMPIIPKWGIYQSCTPTGLQAATTVSPRCQLLLLLDPLLRASGRRDVQLIAHPPFSTQRAFQHCCLCLHSHCRREVCDRWAPARSQHAVLLNSDGWVYISHRPLWQ